MIFWSALVISKYNILFMSRFEQFYSNNPLQGGLLNHIKISHFTMLDGFEIMCCVEIMIGIGMRKISHEEWNGLCNSIDHPSSKLPRFKRFANSNYLRLVTFLTSISITFFFSILKSYYTFPFIIFRSKVIPIEYYREIIRK